MSVVHAGGIACSKQEGDPTLGMLQNWEGDPLGQKVFNSWDVWDPSEILMNIMDPLPRNMYTHAKFAKTFRFTDTQKPIHGFQNNK